MKYNRKLFANIYRVMTGKFITLLFSFLIIVILSRYLTINDFSLYILIVSICSIISMTSNWGTNELLFREASTDNEIISPLLIITRKWKLIAASLLGLLLIVFYGYNNWTFQDNIIFLVLLLASMIDAQSQSYIMIRRAIGDNSTEAKFFSIRSAFRFAAVLSAPILKLKLLGLSIIFLSINFIGLLTLIAQYARCKYIGRAKIFTFKSIVIMATPYAAFGTINTLYSQNSIIILGMLSTKESIAVYGLGMQVYNALMILPVAINIVLQPSLSSYYTNNIYQWKRSIIKASRFIGMGAIIIGALSLIIVPNIAIHIFGDKYKNIEGIVELLIVAYVFRFGVSALIVSTFISTRSISIYTKISSFTLVLNILLNIILVPKYHAYGAAYSLIVCEATNLLLSAASLRKSVKGLLELRK